MPVDFQKMRPMPHCTVPAALSAATALVPYGVTAIGSAVSSLGRELQRVSNRDGNCRTGVITPDAHDIDWSQVLLMSTGVMVAGTACWGLFAWLRQPGGFVAEPPPEEPEQAPPPRRNAVAYLVADQIATMDARQIAALDAALRGRPDGPGGLSAEQLQEWRGTLFTAGTVRGYHDAAAGLPADSSAAGAAPDMHGQAVQPAVSALVDCWLRGYRQGRESAMFWTGPQ